MSRNNVRQWLGVTALLLCCMVSACGANRSTPASTETPPTSASLNPPSVPIDAFVDPQVIAERRGSYAEINFAQLGDEYISGSVVTDAPGDRVRIEPATGGPGWAMYRFADLLPTDTPHTLRVELDAEQSDGELRIGLANYATGRWDWLAGPALGNSSLPIQPTQEVISAGGNAYVIVLAGEGTDLTVTRLVLYIEDILAPPLVVHATQGTIFGYVRVSTDYASYNKDSNGWPHLQGEQVIYRGLTPDGPFEEVHYLDQPTQALGLPPGTVFYYRVARRLGDQIGRMTDAVSGFEGFRAVAHLDGEVLPGTGNLRTVVLDPSRSKINDPRPAIWVEYRLSNGVLIVREHLNPIEVQLDVSQGQVWADMRIYNATNIASAFGGSWVSCLPDDADVADDPAAPDPHETVQVTEDSSTVDLGFVINFGVAPYGVQLQSDFRGDFESAPYATITYAGSVNNSGPVYLSDVHFPGYLPDQEYIFAVRVIDSTGDSRVYAWCTPVEILNP